VPVIRAAAPDAGCHGNLMLVDLTAQVGLDGADGPWLQISARNDVADDAAHQRRLEAALMGASPVMAQIGRKVLPLHTRFSQHLVYCVGWRENAGQRNASCPLSGRKSPALADMGGMHASAGAPTRAHDDRRARRADEVPLQSCRWGDRLIGVESGRSLPGAMAIRLSAGLHWKVRPTDREATVARVLPGS
jgi:hypothetical protein